MLPDKARARLLEKVPLFTTCSELELKLIASQMAELTIPTGRELTEQGRSAPTFYVIVDGRVEAFVDGESHGEMVAGDFFGEISMLGGGPATARTIARRQTRLLAISHRQFRELVKANDRLLTRMHGVMGLRRRKDYAAWRQSDRFASSRASQ